MEHRGKNANRLTREPEEARFAAAWAKQQELAHFDDQCLLAQILDSSGRGRYSLTQEEATVAATVIQWLGSPVGQRFLETLGYTKQ